MKRFSSCYVSAIIFLSDVFCTESPVTTLESDDELKNTKQQVSDCYAGIVIKETRDDVIVLETSSPDQNLSKKLTRNFKKVRDDLSKFTCFYDYYDVLTNIDGSIALIFELINTVLENKTKNEVTFIRIKEEVKSNLKKFNKLVNEVHKIYSEKQNILSENFKNVKNELFNLKKKIILLEDNELEYYNNFDIKNYQTSDNRINELKIVQEELNNLKRQICPLGNENTENCELNEEDLKNDPDLFNRLKTIASEIHDCLTKCYEKESNKLNFIFMFFENISDTVDECNMKLEEYKEEFEK